MADAVDPPELLGVEMDQLARPLTLVADHRRLGLERGPPPEAAAAQHEADGRDRPTEAAGDLWPGQALMAQRHDLGLDRVTEAARAPLRPRRAVGEPGLPRSAWRSRHLRTVFGSTPNAAATAAIVQPRARRRIISRRP
jgi:hypothetical protein